MYKMFLHGSKVVELENKAYQLDYYVTEMNQYISDQELQIYGIKIVNKVTEENRNYYDVEEIKNISYSKAYVQKLIDQLIEHLVTPICMIEIVDGLMTEMEGKTY